MIGEPPLFDVVFTDQPIKDYRDTLKGDKAIATRFNQLLRARGIMKGESKYYVSLAHDQRRHRPHDRRVDRRHSRAQS